MEKRSVSIELPQYSTLSFVLLSQLLSAYVEDGQLVGFSIDEEHKIVGIEYLPEQSTLARRIRTRLLGLSGRKDVPQEERTAERKKEYSAKNTEPLDESFRQTAIVKRIHREAVGQNWDEILVKKMLQFVSVNHRQLFEKNILKHEILLMLLDGTQQGMDRLNESVAVLFDTYETYYAFRMVVLSILDES